MEQIRVSRTERKKEETRKKIIAVAMDLFNKQGFEQTTVEQIAEEADVNKGTIYNHFPAKEAIICEYVQRIIKEQGPEALSQVMQLPDTRSRLIAALRKSLRWMHIELNKDIYEKYFAYRMQRVVQVLRDWDLSLSSGFRDVLAPIIELGKETGEIRRDMDSMALATHLESMHSNIAILWLSHPELFSIDEGIDMIMDLFLNGAKNRDKQ
ncbi:HTH-type transcriptional repressor KstR2 [Pelotomaculum sp. FP]|uniref:TetR/AcrR family transcriptional regulator n=1 Tax=Pelotomaculum sp. FP TaxID=261474 RepID=UPI001065F3C9|nr:TetR/AcrR family transcriptional regulator [Pelotomaculum sp. FP]TEB11512.1 HTH-type transcriptional repressor KstR2 [Pelotomaculum sp. FP]